MSSPSPNDPVVQAPNLSFTAPASQPVTASQFDDPAFFHWCRALGETPRLHRKIWERTIAMQTFARAGMLAPGRRGLGFGVGGEPLPAALAAFGVEVLATDAPPEVAGDANANWIAAGQYASGIEDLRNDRICEPETFSRLVRFRFVDMRDIPKDLRDFDFCWSLGVLEHLGSLKAGLSFIENALDTLKPGGLAVHTTELACDDNAPRIDRGPVVVYTRADLEAFAASLRAAGHRIELDLRLGNTPHDRYVDEPPYRQDLHLRMRLGEVAITSVLLIVRKAGAEHAVLP